MQLISALSVAAANLALVAAAATTMSNFSQTSSAITTGTNHHVSAAAAAAAANNANIVWNSLRTVSRSVNDEEDDDDDNDDVGDTKVSDDYNYNTNAKYTNVRMPGPWIIATPTTTTTTTTRGNDKNFTLNSILNVLVNISQMLNQTIHSSSSKVVNVPSPPFSSNRLFNHNATSVPITSISSTIITPTTAVPSLDQYPQISSSISPLPPPPPSLIEMGVVSSALQQTAQMAAQAAAAAAVVAEPVTSSSSSSSSSSKMAPSGSAALPPPLMPPPPNQIGANYIYGQGRYGSGMMMSGVGLGHPNQMWPPVTHGGNIEESWNSWNRVFKLVFLCFVSTIGSMGSIFIISAITVIDTFQVRSNCYLVSLAFGHLLVTILVLPASAIAIMADVNDDPDMCHFQWIITLATLVVTVLSYLFMAIDNYCGMSSVMHYQMCCTKCRIFFLVTLLWTCAGILPALQHINQWGPEFCKDKRTWKVWIDYHPYLLGVLILCTIVTLAYFTRSLFLYKNYKLQLDSTASSSTAAASAAAVVANETINFVLTDGSLLQSNVIVYLISLVMWLPLIVTMVIDPINPVPQHYLDTMWYIALANSCCYSYMYAATNRDFRDAFNKLFYYCCCKSHVTFTRKGAAMRRTLANESMGLRVHIIPGLNIYAQRKDNAAQYASGSGGGGGGGGGFGGGGGRSGGGGHYSGGGGGHPGGGGFFSGSHHHHKSGGHKSCEL